MDVAHRRGGCEYRAEAGLGSFSIAHLQIGDTERASGERVGGIQFQRSFDTLNGVAQLT